MLLQNVLNVKQVFPEAEVAVLNEQDYIIIRQIEEHSSAIIAGVEKMKAARKHANHIESERDRAIAFHDTIVPLMEEIRKHVDDLEMVVDDELWTLPKYREMLFVH